MGVFLGLKAEKPDVIWPWLAIGIVGNEKYVVGGEGHHIEKGSA